MSPEQALRDAKSRLAQVLGVDAGQFSASAATPSSPQADAVLAWPQGTAELDSANGRIYLVASQQSAGAAAEPLLSPDRLKYQALRDVSDLGWNAGMLAGLGFRQDQDGVLKEDTGLYTLLWSQYDEKSTRLDGQLETSLDGRTAMLVGFDVSLASTGPSIAGAIGEEQAMGIAQTTIFLKTTDLKLPLAGDGALLLANKAVAEKLAVVKDSKITKNKSVLLWVIRITGVVDSKTDKGMVTVGGTVYIDAKTGAVLSYVPYEPD
jgi:hypothetical protein